MIGYIRVQFVCCLFVAIGIVVGMPLLTTAAPAEQDTPCTPPACYTPPTVSQPPTVQNAAAARWEGYTDGRLNPDQAEYYSVWCVDGFVRVLRGVPTTALVDDIPIAEVSELTDGDSLVRDSGLTILRNQGSIILSGGNGNLAAPGQKAFLLDDCLERNGGVAEVKTTDSVQHPLALNVNQVNAQPESTPEVTAEPAVFSNTQDDLPPNNSESTFINLVVQFFKDLCSTPMISTIFMIPAIGKLRKGS